MPGNVGKEKKSVNVNVQGQRGSSKREDNDETQMKYIWPYVCWKKREKEVRKRGVESVGFNECIDVWSLSTKRACDGILQQSK